MISVVVLTYNRKGMFERTINSLLRQTVPITLRVVDNGSTDGTADLVRQMGGYVNEDGNHTVGHGMNIAITAAIRPCAKIVLFSADDYEYKPDALEKLGAFWACAPDDIILASCNLEPRYSWNSIIETVDYGGVHAITRTSIGGSNWSFRARDWDKIGPVSEKTGGEDLEICSRLTRSGYRLAALDLCEHIGEKQSAWGNQSWMQAREIEKIALGFID